MSKLPAFPTMISRTLVIVLALTFAAFSTHAAENKLSPAEKSAGWQLLFDGQSFKGWRGYKLTEMP
jgi:hypothetical protein